MPLLRGHSVALASFPEFFASVGCMMLGFKYIHLLKNKKKSSLCVTISWILLSNYIHMSYIVLSSNHPVSLVT